MESIRKLDASEVAEALEAWLQKKQRLASDPQCGHFIHHVEPSDDGSLLVFLDIPE